MLELFNAWLFRLILLAAEKALAPVSSELLQEAWKGGRASARVQVFRPTRWRSETEPDPDSYVLVDESVSHNIITDAGRDFLHQQGYAASGLGSNGFIWIALSDDPFTEDESATSLSGEITTNGLARAEGTVTHVPGSNLTTIEHTFTCNPGPQFCRKACLGTEAVGGIVNHILPFPRRHLSLGETIKVQFLIYLG